MYPLSVVNAIRLVHSLLGRNMMKLGINGTGLVQQASIEAISLHAGAAAEDGFSSYWLAEHPTGGLDAMTVLTVVGLQVPQIELGTAIVPTFPRHRSVSRGHDGANGHSI